MALFLAIGYSIRQLVLWLSYYNFLVDFHLSTNIFHSVFTLVSEHLELTTVCIVYNVFTRVVLTIDRVCGRTSNIWAFKLSLLQSSFLCQILFLMLQKVILTLILMKSLGVTFRQMQKDTEQFFHMVLFTFVRGSYNLLVCQS